MTIQLRIPDSERYRPPLGGGDHADWTGQISRNRVIGARNSQVQRSTSSTFDIGDGRLTELSATLGIGKCTQNATTLPVTRQVNCRCEPGSGSSRRGWSMDYYTYGNLQVRSGSANLPVHQDASKETQSRKTVALSVPI